MAGVTLRAALSLTGGYLRLAAARVVKEEEGEVPSGVHGEARSLVTYCSQQRRPGRVPRFFLGRFIIAAHRACMCLGVRGPVIAELRSVRVV